MKPVFILTVLLLMSCAAPVTAPESKNINDRIKVISPQPYDEVGAKFTVTGKARGPFFFEASFPVEVELTNGELKSFYATAKGDWMTTDFVPFETEIDLSEFPAQDIIVRLIRANPSDLPENDMQVDLPLTLKK